jgi:hypothetical protein
MGPNSRFVNVRLLTEDVDSMVNMSVLQGSTFEVIQEAEEIGVLGAAVNAAVALTSAPKYSGPGSQTGVSEIQVRRSE